MGAHPDDGVAQDGRLADAGRAADDRPLDEGLLLDDAVRLDDGVDDLGAGLDGRRRVDPREVVDHGLLVDALAAAARLDGRVRQLSGEQIEVRLDVPARGADVHPVTVRDEREDRYALGEQRREEVVLEREDLLGRNVLEHVRLDDVDPGVDRVGRDLVALGLLEEALDAAVLLGLDEPVGARVLDRRQHDRDDGLSLLVEGDDVLEVDVGEDVAVEDDGPVVDDLTRVLVGARGAERLRLDDVADPHVVMRSVAEDVLDLLWLVGEAEDDVVDVDASEQVQLIGEKRRADERHDGLRGVQRQGPQAGAFSACENHGLHRRAMTPSKENKSLASRTPRAKTRSRRDFASRRDVASLHENSGVSNNRSTPDATSAAVRRPCARRPRRTRPRAGCTGRARDRSA